MSWLISRALMDHYENSRSSPGRAAESSAESCSAVERSAQSSTTPTPQAYLSRDKTTDAWSRFPSGMTCAPLTAGRGEELLTWYRAGFHVKTSRPQAKAPGSTASAADSGRKWPASLARYDRDSALWKTRQCLLLGGLEEFSETWPRWGTTRDGELYRQPTPSGLLAIRAYITSAKEYGLSLQAPTPTVFGNYNRKGASDSSGDGLATWIKLPTPTVRDRTKDAPNRKGGASLGVTVRQLATPTARDWKSGKASQATMERNSRPLSEQVGGQLNPTWVEWLQGFPIEWTVLDVSEMPKFRSWLLSHGRSLRVAMERILES